MLSPYDDYPIHQAGAPVAQPATGDPNAYDRYFFCGYNIAGPLYFAAAMGHYPNRDVMDAAFSVLIDGRQTSLIASQRIPAERHTTTLGPITVSVVEPLRTLHFAVDAPAQDVRAELTFTARTPALEEPRQVMMSDHKTAMDSTRLAQSGTWSGWIELEGERTELDASNTFGTRDRSWGIRPVGEPIGGAPPRNPQGIYWLWAPANFAERATFLGMSEDASGAPTFLSGASCPILRPGAATYGQDAWARVRHARRVDASVNWRPGTRRAAAATVTLAWPDGTSDELHYEPIADFQMKGIGYTDPEWGHGRYHGEATEVTVKRWSAAEQNPMNLENLHVHQLCRVTCGEEVGAGVFEQLVIGPHAPSGFSDWFDGAASR